MISLTCMQTYVYERFIFHWNSWCTIHACCLVLFAVLNISLNENDTFLDENAFFASTICYQIGEAIKSYNYCTINTIGVLQLKSIFSHFKSLSIMHLALKICICGVYLFERRHAAPLQTTPASQQICSMHAIDLAFVLDHSGSIDQTQFEELRQFVSKVISHVSLDHS